MITFVIKGLIKVCAYISSPFRKNIISDNWTVYRTEFFYS